MHSWKNAHRTSVHGVNRTLIDEALKATRLAGFVSRGKGRKSTTA